MPSIKVVLGAGVAVVASLTVVSCSSSGGGAPSTSNAGTSGPAGSSSSASVVASTPPTSSAASSPAAPLSGKWAGNYHGSFSGTFTLNWTQQGSKLSGVIDLSTAGRTPLNGTVIGNRISFGTVGSIAITYTGSVSGDTMSGTYQVGGGAAGHGTWSAHRA
jgi:hypothetical protein